MNIGQRGNRRRFLKQQPRSDDWRIIGRRLSCPDAIPGKRGGHRKECFGQEYSDYNLVMALSDGSPIEPKLCEKWFKKWQHKARLGLPEIIFHEIRHSSTTYKLGVSSGDIKTLQGDTGHASAEMVVNTYSHMQDSKRAVLMNTIERDFYGDENMESPLSDEAVTGLLEAIKKDPLLQQKALDALLAHRGIKSRC